MIETRGRKPYLDISKKLKVIEDLKTTSLLEDQIAIKNAVSVWSVQKIKKELNEKIERPEPETFEVIKINSAYLEDALRILSEFEIKYELPEGRYELLEYFESKINK